MTDAPVMADAFGLPEPSTSPPIPKYYVRINGIYSEPFLFLSPFPFPWFFFGLGIMMRFDVRFDVAGG
jgi:hypothetical protein